MEYRKTVILKDGRECLLRNGTEQDAKAVLENFILTHTETDLLLSYPDEIRFTEAQEAEYLKKHTESEREAEIVAEADGRIVGTAGIDAVGSAEKVRHRAGFGISVEKAFWGLGIGRALTEACIECAGRAGYAQMELEVLEGNERAIALYRSAGFEEYGRNPMGFRSRESGMQEVVLMRRSLEGRESEK